MASNIINCCTYDVLGSPLLHPCSRQNVSSFIRVVCAINLQRINWRHSTTFVGFLIGAGLIATHQSTSYIDLQFRVFIDKHNTIYNLHGCSLPMFQRHTREVMFEMVSNFLTAFCPDWTIRLVCLASDGPRNMTTRIVGIVTRHCNAMYEECSIIRQLDLVIEHIMNDVIYEMFFFVMIGFITHLTRQQKPISDMDATCPRVVNRSLPTEKVTK